MEKIEKMYTIKLNRDQLNSIANALEVVSRMRCGQLETNHLTPLNDEICKKVSNSKKSYSEIKDQVDKYLESIKKEIWDLDSNSSYGIGYNKKSDLEYEMYKVILSKFEKEREEYCITKGKKYYSNVHTGNPLKLTNIPFIEIKDYYDDEYFNNLPKK